MYDLIHISPVNGISVQFYGEYNILVYVQNRHQIIILKYKADISSAEYCELFVIHFTDFFTSDLYTPRTGNVQSAQHIQKS